MPVPYTIMPSDKHPRAVQSRGCGMLSSYSAGWLAALLTSGSPPSNAPHAYYRPALNSREIVAVLQSIATRVEGFTHSNISCCGCHPLLQTPYPAEIRKGWRSKLNRLKSDLKLALTNQLCITLPVYTAIVAELNAWPDVCYLVPLPGMSRITFLDRLFHSNVPQLDAPYILRLHYDLNQMPYIRRLLRRRPR